MSNAGTTFIELERNDDGFQRSSSNNTTTTIVLHLIPSPSRLEECLPPKFQKDLTDYFARRSGKGFSINMNDKEYSKIIHLHEDIWNSKQRIVHHRLMAQLGLGVHEEPTLSNDEINNNRRGAIRRIFARKTIVRRIPSLDAMKFLDEHHLWGATKAKHNYGLFVRGTETKDSDDELVAVATFSAKRKIVRLGKRHNSHELLRFCSKKDSHVVGGISKLIKAFVAEKEPDDIVTLIDRDWGDGSGWESLGFHSVATMDPIAMAVCSSNTDAGLELTRRRHLVGAGIKSIDDVKSEIDGSRDSGTSLKFFDRIGLSKGILEELDCLDSFEEVLHTLSKHKHFPVYDTGVERMMKVIAHDSKGNPITTSQSDIEKLWETSQPTYAKNYYSPNLGIAALLDHASSVPSALPLLMDGDNEDSTMEEVANNHIYDDPDN